MALAKVIVVVEYWLKLLCKSGAAHFFQSEVLSLLNQGLKRPQSGTNPKWEYPVINHVHVIDIRQGGEEVSTLINHILKHRFAMIKLGGLAYLNVIASEVSESIHHLLNVSNEVVQLSKS